MLTNNQEYIRNLELIELTKDLKELMFNIEIELTAMPTGIPQKRTIRQFLDTFQDKYIELLTPVILIKETNTKQSK